MIVLHNNQRRLNTRLHTSSANAQSCSKSKVNSMGNYSLWGHTNCDINGHLSLLSVKSMSNVIVNFIFPTTAHPLQILTKTKISKSAKANQLGTLNSKIRCISRPILLMKSLHKFHDQQFPKVSLNLISKWLALGCLQYTHPSKWSILIDRSWFEKHQMIEIDKWECRIEEKKFFSCCFVPPLMN